jgi:hypothetical protein
MASKDGWVAPFLSIEKNPKIFYKDKKGVLLSQPSANLMRVGEG